jgi:hypothetical protein
MRISLHFGVNGAAPVRPDVGPQTTMSFMFEVYYRSPEDPAREERLCAAVIAEGGRLDFREPAIQQGGPVCLTFEFESRERAESVAETLRKSGEHVEGVSDYG